MIPTVVIHLSGSLSLTVLGDVTPTPPMDPEPYDTADLSAVSLLPESD